jgi:hypothetical protein
MMSDPTVQRKIRNAPRRHHDVLDQVTTLTGEFQPSHRYASVTSSHETTRIAFRRASRLNDRSVEKSTFGVTGTSTYRHFDFENFGNGRRRHPRSGREIQSPNRC